MRRYYRPLVESDIWPIKSCHFRWPWVAFRACTCCKPFQMWLFYTHRIFTRTLMLIICIVSTTMLPANTKQCIESSAHNRVSSWLSRRLTQVGLIVLQECQLDSENLLVLLAINTRQNTARYRTTARRQPVWRHLASLVSLYTPYRFWLL